MAILPTTRLGRWSCGLIMAFFLLLVLVTIIVNLFNQEGGKTFFDNLFISIPMLSAVTAAIAASITGIISMWKHKERSILVFTATTTGLLIVLFVLGESTSSY